MELELQPLALPGIPEERPIVIAGPCSAETEEQVMNTATALAKKGVKIFRAGIWKPRTKPGGFEGVGTEGLAWMQRVKQETGMLTATEVATPKHVEEALKAGIDLLWVGARTTANPFAMQELADSLRGVDVPVLVKNPVNPDLELWIGALQRINGAGLKRLGAIHRGFSSFDKKIYVIFHNGIFLSNCVAVFQKCLSSVIRRTSVVSVNWLLRFANKPWTWASMALSLKATAIRMQHGAMLLNKSLQTF